MIEEADAGTEKSTEFPRFPAGGTVERIAGRGHFGLCGIPGRAHRRRVIRRG